MSYEIFQAKADLADLVATFAITSDERRLPDQMKLFTPDAHVEIWMGENLAFDISGTEKMLEIFTAFTADVKRLFHMNGQQIFTVNGDTATGIVYCEAKLISGESNAETITVSSIRYDDTYVLRDGRWLIATRISHFSINDTRPLAT
ncbi:nuclear transport factor 2 family protein [Arthrobacter bussei]|uniref:nuclear transport factor 2 family protein n=1 Tax=Arthrobacter bussei TaxID=2594179 RepID=UPI00128E4542